MISTTTAQVKTPVSVAVTRLPAEFPGVKGLLDSMRNGSKAIWSPNLQPGAFYKETLSQGEAYSRAVELLGKTDRYAKCDGAERLASATSTLQERQTAIFLLMSVISEQLDVKVSTGFYLADVVTSASTALMNLRATDALPLLEKVLTLNGNKTVAEAVAHDIAKLESVPPQPAEPGEFMKSVKDHVTINSTGWVPQVKPGEIFRDAPSQDESFAYHMALVEKHGDPDAQSQGANNITKNVATPDERTAAIAALVPLTESPFKHVASSAKEALGELGTPGFEAPVTPGWYEHG